MICIYDLEYKNNIISVVGVIENEETEEVYFQSYLIEIKVILPCLYLFITLFSIGVIFIGFTLIIKGQIIINIFNLIKILTCVISPLSYLIKPYFN